VKQPEATYSAKVPTSIQTPDTAQNRIGTLKFFDGFPTLPAPIPAGQFWSFTIYAPLK
jgi:hypothetical protein